MERIPFDHLGYCHSYDVNEVLAFNECRFVNNGDHLVLAVHWIELKFIVAQLITWITHTYSLLPVTMDAIVGVGRTHSSS